MAKRKTNKSAAIREAMAANPSKSAADIAKDLGVSPALVYNVKASMKKKSGKRGRKPSGKATAPEFAHAALDSAFEFINRVGGLINAEAMINKLKSLKDRM